jgi:hypothetical protein
MEGRPSLDAPPETAMAINVTCSCGRRQTVAKALAGRTVTCVGCGGALSIPPLEVLRQQQAEAQAAAANPPQAAIALAGTSRRVLSLAIAGLVMLGAIGTGAWFLGHLPRQQPDPAGRTEGLPRETDLTELRKPEPEDPPTPPAEKVVPLPPAKPLVHQEPDAAVEPVKPSVPPLEKPRAKDVPAIRVKDLTARPKSPGLVWELKQGQTFYQEVIVTQKPSFNVQGLPVQLLLQYRVVSRLTVEKVDADGSRVVQQKVERARLLQADKLTQAAVTGPIAKLPGQTWRLRLSPKLEVTRLDADGEKPPAAMPILGGQGVQLASLLDRDSWKELAQMTFFQRENLPRAKERWSRPLTHSWGALGSWSGHVHYEYLGLQGTTHQVGFTLQLKYQAPPGDVVLAGMQISSASFQPQQAEGLLSFDTARGRVVAAQERFRVKGALTAKLLGQPTALELEEDQQFLIRIHEREPE